MFVAQNRYRVEVFFCLNKIDEKKLDWHNQASSNQATYLGQPSQWIAIPSQRSYLIATTKQSILNLQLLFLNHVAWLHISKEYNKPHEIRNQIFDS